MRNDLGFENGCNLSESRNFRHFDQVGTEFVDCSNVRNAVG